jgi:MoaA/NifB/PqqE/SkfB family radical SAM enzyme
MNLGIQTSSGSPSVLGLLITSKCNIVCRHCCNDSHPLNSGSVTFEEAARLIEMAREIPTIREIGISGGEPFLFITLLRGIVQAASCAGFTSSITTNGFWGRAPELASPLLSELKQHGLRAINLSTSVFHQEYIDLSILAKAASMGLEAGLDVCINLVSTSSLTGEALKSALGDLSKQVEFVVMPCLAAGRGAAAVRDEEFERGFEAPAGNCREHFKKLAVDRSGQVYPCCSPGGFTPPLLMGNVRESSLGSIWKRSAENKLLAILEEVGPQFFLPFLRRAPLDPPLPQRFSDQCDLCNFILSKADYAATVAKVSEQLFDQLGSLGPAERPEVAGRLFRLVNNAVGLHA